MTVSVYVFDVVVAAGVPKGVPLVVQLPMPARRVDDVEIVFPPGPRGLVGIALGSSGTTVIPDTPNPNVTPWIVSDNEVIRWHLEDYWDSGSWEAHAYNLGVHSHTITLRFLCSLVAGPGSSAPPIPADQLGAGPAVQPQPAPAPPPPLPPVGGFPGLPPVPPVAPPPALPSPV